MKRVIILLLISIFCFILVSCNVASENSSKEHKSLYELAVEAGFEGTIEEWSEAIANIKDASENKVECTCQKNITLADAIIIAQTHYFSAYYTNSFDESMIHVAELHGDDLENWYINIAPKDITNDDVDLIHKGQFYLYTISKETGTITEIKASGE